MSPEKLRFRLRTVVTQPVHVEFDCRDGHGDAPVFQDFGVEFADQPDGLSLGENGARSAIEERAVTQGFEFVVLHQIEHEDVQAGMHFGKVRVGMGDDDRESDRSS